MNGVRIGPTAFFKTEGIIMKDRCIVLSTGRGDSNIDITEALIADLQKCIQTAQQRGFKSEYTTHTPLKTT